MSNTLYGVFNEWSSGVPSARREAPYATRFAAECRAFEMIDQMQQRRAVWSARADAEYDGTGYYRNEAMRIQHQIDTTMVRELTWREREGLHFEEQVYEHLPWVNETFWTANPAIHADHFAHVSVEEPSMIAFTASEQHGEQNRQTRMRPGKYLMRFFSDHLTPKQVAFYSEWFARKERPVEETGAELRFASTQDEVEEVYANGPRSCMTETEAVRVYSGGDIQLAYLYDEEGTINPRGNKVLARAICWPENKVFGRVYPTVDRYFDDGYKSPGEAEAVHMDLFNRLRKQGYMHVSEGGSFDGAKLPLIRDGGILCPYLDNDYGVDIDRDGGWLIMRECDNADYSADNTDGYLEGGDYDWSCGDCGGYSDHVTSYSAHSYWSPERGSHSYITICWSCYENRNYFRCEATDDIFDGDHMGQTEVYVSSTQWTETWNTSYADEHAWECELTNELYSKHHHDPVVLHDGRKISNKAFENEEGFVCPHDGLNYLGDEASEAHPGYPATMDDLDIERIAA